MGNTDSLPTSNGLPVLAPLSDASLDPALEHQQARRTPTTNCMAIDDASFARLVDLHYESLYRFALSLARSEADARDLVQDTFAELARKGHQLKSLGKAKSWLFTTLYRAFVDCRRRDTRHPKVEMEAAEPELPVLYPEPGLQLDARFVCAQLAEVDEVFRVPLILFYLEEHSYAEIAEILNIPSGTVMSRISRGRAILRRLMEVKTQRVTNLHTNKPAIQR
jgi:RNA polymerase sigma-70 factor, ECF subfamily